MEAPPPPPGAQAGTPLRRDGFGQRTSGVGLQRAALRRPSLPGRAGDLALRIRR